MGVQWRQTFLKLVDSLLPDATSGERCEESKLDVRRCVGMQLEELLKDGTVCMCGS